MANDDDDEDGKRKKKLILAGVIFLAALGTAGFMLSGKAPEELAAGRVFKCVECGKEWGHTISLGEGEPLKCPKCKKEAGYEAEKCYWKKMPDGTMRAKKKPTYVVWKNKINHETEEETICPDCGMKIVGHNPQPPPEEMQRALDK